MQDSDAHPMTGNLSSMESIRLRVDRTLETLGTIETKQCNVKDVLVEDNVASSSEKRFAEEIDISLSETNKNASNNKYD